MSALDYFMNKEAISSSALKLPQSRAGRKPMSVSTLLRKDNDGSLYKDVIPGGRADHSKPADFDQQDLAAGTKIEREHASNPQLACEIAMDHLTEHPAYYQALKGMEEGLEASEKKTAGSSAIHYLLKQAAGSQSVIMGPGQGGPEALTPQLDAMFQLDSGKLPQDYKEGDYPTVEANPQAASTKVETSSANQAAAVTGAPAKTAAYMVNPYLYMRQAVAKTEDKPMDVERSEKRLRNLQFALRPDELARSAAIGAVAGPALKVMGDIGESELKTKWGGGKGLQRGLTAAALGATTGAALPFLRNRVERYSEAKRLEKLRAAHGMAPPPPVDTMPAEPVSADLAHHV